MFVSRNITQARWIRQVRLGGVVRGCDCGHYTALLVTMYNLQLTLRKMKLQGSRTVWMLSLEVTRP